MKKGIFSMLLLAGSLWISGATAQASFSVRTGHPVYCPPPVRVVVTPPSPARVVMVKPAPVVVARAKPVVIVRPAPPPPVYVIARPKRKIVVYR